MAAGNSPCVFPTKADAETATDPVKKLSLLESVGAEQQKYEHAVELYIAAQQAESDTTLSVKHALERYTEARNTTKKATLRLRTDGTMSSRKMYAPADLLFSAASAVHAMRHSPPA